MGAAGDGASINAADLTRRSVPASRAWRSLFDYRDLRAYYHFLINQAPDAPSRTHY
jgi:hypothetical protein